MKTWIAAALFLFAPLLQAQNPRVLLDTEAGPILLELDASKPLHTANFLTYVDEGFYDGLVFHRVIKDFVIQSGKTTVNNTQVLNAALHPPIASERGRANTRGTLALALNNLPDGNTNSDVNSGRNEFYINTKTNPTLDTHFTVFGDVVYGMQFVDAIGNAAVYSTSAGVAFRPVAIRRAVRTSGFPILDLHSGSWYDPAKSGRGVSVEIANDPADSKKRKVIVYWYDYLEGRQVWMNGVASINLGASEVVVPLQITAGGQFGNAFDPAQVTTDGEWGSMMIRFSGCSAGTFSYVSEFGSGEMALQRLSIPDRDVCAAN